MSVTSILLIAVLALAVVGVLVLFVAMFTEMGTKRSSGTMKGNARNKHKARRPKR
jgi:NADH:ubiquinone oxidoreductase subunit 6 (subunit J)